MPLPSLPDASTPLLRKLPLKFHRRVWSGVLPVMKELRVGEHTACCTYELLNCTPDAASLARFGATSRSAP